MWRFGNHVRAVFVLPVEFCVIGRSSFAFDLEDARKHTEGLYLRWHWKRLVFGAASSDVPPPALPWYSMYTQASAMFFAVAVDIGMSA